MIITRYATNGDQFVIEQIEWAESSVSNKKSKSIIFPGADGPGIYMALTASNILAAPGKITNNYYNMPLKGRFKLITEQEYNEFIAENDRIISEAVQASRQAAIEESEVPPLTKEERQALRAFMATQASGNNGQGQGVQ